jgi:hypothetical protein
MKKLSPPSFSVLLVLIGVLLAFLSVAFGPLAPSLQPTPTPAPVTPDLDLEIGSTDGILIWAVLITLVVTIPLFWRLWHKDA